MSDLGVPDGEELLAQYIADHAYDMTCTPDGDHVIEIGMDVELPDPFADERKDR